jgi:hypothetical protein
MISDKVPSPYSCHHLDRFHQGDILRDITLFEPVYKEEEGKNRLKIQEKPLKYAVIINQECDLDLDVKFRNNEHRETDDKFLNSILLIPAYPAENVRKGDHIADLTMQKLSKEQLRLVKSNRDFRYHYFPAYLEYQVPELIADFKHYFTIPRDTFYIDYKNSEHYIASLLKLFREDLSIRFAQYLARIGLPEIENNQTEECNN